MNTEMVDRLAASFNRQRTGEALDFSHGGRLAGSVQIIAKVIEFAAHEALLLSPDGRGKDWLSEPYVFDQVAKALGRVIEGLRPVGDPAPPTLTDANSHTTQNGFDVLRQLKTETMPSGNLTQTRTYDPAGNLLSLTDYNGKTTTYTYDALNRITQVSLGDGSTIDYTWDSAGNLVSIAIKGQ